MKKQLLIIPLLCLPSLHGTSLVYNLKIRRTFAGIGSFIKHGDKAAVVFSGLPIIYHRTAHVINPDFLTDVHTKRLGGGAILNLRYIPSKCWWAEITTAVEKESLSSKGTATFSTSRTGFDDVVLAAGRNFFIGEEAQYTMYGLAGFPTKWSISRFDALDGLVGTRFYSVGGGAELSYRFLHTEHSSVAGVIQLRAIHFFDRSWEAIFGPGGRIQPGQLIDLLFSARYLRRLTSVETGYNPTFFVDQAALLPTQTIQSKTAVRHGVYLSVMHLLEHHRLFDKPIALGAGFNFNRLGRFDANSYLAWLNITLIF